MSSKKLRELEKRINQTLLVEVGATSKEIAATVSRSRFYEFIIGCPRSDMLLFILARTLSFGKHFSFIQDYEFMQGVSDLLPGCYLSEKTIWTAKKGLLDKKLIMSLAAFSGAKLIGTAYALSPRSILKFHSGCSFSRLPQWRKNLIKELWEFFEIFEFMPSVLRVTMDGEVIDGYERGSSEGKRKNRQKQAKTGGETKKEEATKKVINFFR